MKNSTAIVALFALAASMGIGAWLDGRRVEAQGGTTTIDCFVQWNGDIKCGSIITKNPFDFQFDVPPKEWKITRCELRGRMDCGFSPDDWEKVTQRTCKDKSRFLLMSEDQTWHCLALGKP